MSCPIVWKPYPWRLHPDLNGIRIPGLSFISIIYGTSSIIPPRLSSDLKPKAFPGLHGGWMGSHLKRGKGMAICCTECGKKKRGNQIVSVLPLFLVDPQGLEPRLTVPKTGVLPLHHGSSHLCLSAANLVHIFG